MKETRVSSAKCDRREGAVSRSLPDVAPLASVTRLVILQACSRYLRYPTVWAAAAAQSHVPVSTGPVAVIGCEDNH